MNKAAPVTFLRTTARALVTTTTSGSSTISSTGGAGALNIPMELHLVHEAKKHGVLIVGASPKQTRASHDVMRTLLENQALNFDCIPINPVVAAADGAAESTTILGKKCFSSLTDYCATSATRSSSGSGSSSKTTQEEHHQKTKRVVCIFRSDPEPIVLEAIRLGFRNLWLQLGLFVSEETEKKAIAEAILSSSCDASSSGENLYNNSGTTAGGSTRTVASKEDSGAPEHVVNLVEDKCLKVEALRAAAMGGIKAANL
ncbi:unnamed protein product [Amoebophrya sp. A120]|nr:unnamed protein product [Amoebophrya sp. A120]|eukprot:GSA120T00013378001.1